MKKTVLLVGGGTGGHIMPILSLRAEIEKNYPDISVVTVGGDSPIDRKLFSGLKGHIVLKTGKLHRSITIKNTIQLMRLISGMVSSLMIMKRTKPSLIFSKAGYVSLPIIIWAKLLKIPYFIHESDVEMGASNKFAANGAKRVFVGFPAKYYPGIDKTKIEYTGQILRSDISAPQKEEFDFGFSEKKPIIFVTGGSQGSSNINKSVLQIIERILPKYNLIHHTGSLDYERAVAARSKLTSANKLSYFLSPLLTTSVAGVDMMKSAIMQSELVISRASATTMAEASMMKKAMIIVPYKYAASDHQTKNATVYKENGSAIVITDDDLTGEVLFKRIQDLFLAPGKKAEIGRKAYNLQNANGLSKIAKEISEYIAHRKCEKI